MKSVKVSIKSSTKKTVRKAPKITKRNVGRPVESENILKLSAMWIEGKSIEAITTACGFKNAHVTYQRINFLRKQYGEDVGNSMFPKRSPGRRL